MSDLILKQIEKRARLDHDGDFVKAAEQYFRDHPQDARPQAEPSPDRELVNAEVEIRVEGICLRDGLDVRNPTDRATAMEKLFAADPALYKRAREVNTVRVGKVSLER